MKRKLSEISLDIMNNWSNINPYAQEYLKAMRCIDSNDIDAMYYMDSAKMIVAYFLSNADGWRGDAARRIKKELRDNYKIK